MRERRNGKGVFVSILIMFTLVLFLGSLFWLFTERSFISGNSENTLFKPAQGECERTLNQTIAELQRSGVIVTRYMKEYSGGYVNASYDSFISEALRVHSAFRAIDFNGTEVLLVETPEMVLQWYPDTE